MSYSSPRMPGASIRNSTGGHGAPRSGRTTNVSIAPAAVGMSSVFSIIGSSPLAVARDRVGEVDDVLIGHGRQHMAHEGVVAPPLVRIVLAQGIEQVVLTLAGVARDVHGTGEVWPVTEEATILLQQGAALRDPRRVAGVGDRRW